MTMRLRSSTAMEWLPAIISLLNSMITFKCSCIYIHNIIVLTYYTCSTDTKLQNLVSRYIIIILYYNIIGTHLYSCCSYRLNLSRAMRYFSFNFSLCRYTPSLHNIRRHRLSNIFFVYFFYYYYYIDHRLGFAGTYAQYTFYTYICIVFILFFTSTTSDNDYSVRLNLYTYMMFYRGKL